MNILDNNECVGTTGIYRYRFEMGRGRRNGDGVVYAHARADSSVHTHFVLNCF